VIKVNGTQTAEVVQREIRTKLNCL
jgi:hypothetical protein